MRLIIGLGNPGTQYESTRHNAGFLALNYLQKKLDQGSAASPWSESKKFNAEISEGKIGNKKIIFLKPQTFMNESGKAVRSAVMFYKIKTIDCIIVYDDIDLPFGNIRLRMGGSSGGHKGVESIISELGTENIPRLRIGIRPDHLKIPDAKTFVLKKFAKEEQKLLFQIFKTCEEALNTAYAESFVKAMSLYNTKKMIDNLQ